MAMQMINQENYNVGIYARLSRDDERIGESVSIENQKELLGRYAREQGWNIYGFYMKNVMNDLYARDTSNKIKAVKQSTFKSGKYVGCYAPLGYRKSSADKHVLEIDPITSPVVKHIFDMRLQGNGFRKIAVQLNAEGVPAPRTFYYMAEGRENPRSETPYWNDVTVKTILRNEVYIGHMVQNKTGTVSYKNHKQVDNTI